MNCRHLKTIYVSMGEGVPYIECNECLNIWTEDQWMEYKEQQKLNDYMLESQATGN